MRVGEILEAAQQPPTITATAKKGVTADGIPYTLTVIGGSEADRAAVLKVGDLAGPVVTTPVTIDPATVRGSLDPQEEHTPEPPPGFMEQPLTVPSPFVPTLEHPVEEASYRELRDYVWHRLRHDLHEYEQFQHGLKRLIRSHTNGPVYFNNIGHSVLLETSRRMAETLTDFRHLLEFLRTGYDGHGSEAFFNDFYRSHNNFRNAFWTFWNMKHPNGPGSRATRSTPVLDMDNLQAGDVVPPTGESPAAAMPETHYPEHETDPVETISELEMPPPTQPAAAEPPAETTNPVITPENPAEDDGSGIPQRCETCGRFVSRISRCCSHCGRRY